MTVTTRQTPPRPILLTVEDARLLCRVDRCHHCGGRLYIDPPVLGPGRLLCRDCGRVVAEVVDRLPVQMTPEQFAAESPKRGRPPGSGTKRWAKGFDDCVICHRTDSHHNARGRCNRCKNRDERAKDLWLFDICS